MSSTKITFLLYTTFKMKLLMNLLAFGGHLLLYSFHQNIALSINRAHYRFVTHAEIETLHFSSFILEAIGGPNTYLT